MDWARRRQIEDILAEQQQIYAERVLKVKADQGEVNHRKEELPERSNSTQDQAAD